MQIINVPKSLSFKKPSLKDTIIFLSKIVAPKNRSFALNFSYIEEMEKGDLMVFAAQLEKSTSELGNKVYRNGKWPKKRAIRKLILAENSVIHEKKLINIEEISNFEKEKLIDPFLIDTIVKDLKKIGIKEYYTTFNTFLTELIANAVEHGIQNKNINWWLTSSIDRKNKKIIYTFVDMGLGIVNSHKKAGLPFKYLFLGKNRIVTDAFGGKLASSTKKSNRGRGLPQLREIIEKNYISNAIIITNCVYMKFENNNFITESIPNFEGTYFSWTIEQSNFEKWKNTK